MFWKQLSELIDGYTVQLTIKNEDDKMIVLIVPNINDKKDQVKSTIIPLTLNGTAEQLDEQFFMAVTAGLKKTAQLQSNVEEYNKSIDAAAAKLKTDPKKTGKTAKADTSGLFKPSEDKKPVEQTSDEEEDTLDDTPDEDPEVDEDGVIIEPEETKAPGDEKPKVEKPKVEKPKPEPAPPMTAMKEENDLEDDQW